ncbi:MAG: MerR family DNA-binding protein [Verrucomicrobia bacterium]|nr:MerR family DNA-binding protein [Verrucomicrobiota bacterium]
MTEQTIGQVARAAGVGVETVRFYERQQLLPAPKRNGVGYRQYPPGTVSRLRFVKRAQALGFSLSEIGELLSLRASPRSTCGQMRGRAEMKRSEIDKKLRDLRRLRRALDKVIQECSGDGPATRCPILAALEGEVR